MLYIGRNLFYKSADYISTIASMSNNKLVFKTSDYLTKHSHNVARGTYVLNLSYKVKVGNEEIAKKMADNMNFDSNTDTISSLAKIVIRIV